LKSILEKDISHYLSLVAEKEWNPVSQKRLKGTKKTVSALNDAYDYDLPVWYKIILKRKGESPSVAQKHLMSLAGTKDASHAEKRLENAKAALLIQ
jgi:hypothetical protein